MGGTWGLIWWSTRAGTIALVVHDGLIVDCPLHATTWAHGRNARDLWRQGVRDGATLKWLPEGHHLLRGLIRWHTTHDRIDVAVDGELVVDCPAYMAGKLRGKAAVDAWRAGRDDGVDLRWVPTWAVPTSVQLQLTSNTQLRRWRHPRDTAMLEHFISVGTLSDGRWYVHDTGGRAWAFTSMGEAAAAAGVWMRGNDRYRSFPAQLRHAAQAAAGP